MSTWTNNDGLYIKYGTTEGVSGRGGEFDFDGEHLTEFTLNLTDVPAVSAPLVVGETSSIPKGAILTKAEVFVLTASVGTNANLDLGYVDQDRTTEIDFNGILAASDDWHTGAAGTTTTFVLGSTEAGVLLGKPVANTALISANYDTAAFTDGRLRIRLYWYIPNAA